MRKEILHVKLHCIKGLTTYVLNLFYLLTQIDWGFGMEADRRPCLGVVVIQYWMDVLYGLSSVLIG